MQINNGRASEETVHTSHFSITPSRSQLSTHWPWRRGEYKHEGNPKALCFTLILRLWESPDVLNLPCITSIHQFVLTTLQHVKTSF